MVSTLLLLFVIAGSFAYRSKFIFLILGLVEVRVFSFPRCKTLTLGRRFSPVDPVCKTIFPGPADPHTCFPFVTLHCVNTAYFCAFRFRTSRGVSARIR